MIACTNLTLVAGRRARMPGWAIRMAIFVAAGAMSCGSWADLARAAEQEADSEAVQAGQEALSKQPALPWYDSKTDDLRRIDLAPPEPAKQQNPSQTPSNGNQSTRGNGSGGSGSSSAPIPPMAPAVSDSVQWFAWLLIALVLAVLAYLLISAFLTRENKAAISGDATDDADDKPRGDRVEALPFQVRRARGDFLDEARYHYEQGNYREAIIYLYSYQLLQLDKNQFIRLEKGKTNRQYLGEARRQQPLGNLLEGTMVAFEDVFFGDHPIDRERFEHCWTLVPQFNQLVQQVAA